MLLTSGSDVNTYNDYGHTPLSIAIKYGSSSMVEILLGNGAVTECCFTSLSRAMRRDKKEKVEILRRYGVDQRNQHCD